MKQALLDYIKQAQAQGMTREKIIAFLREAGWQEGQIQEAFAPQVKQSKKIPPLFIVGAIALAFILIAGGATTALYTETWNPGWNPFATEVENKQKVKDKKIDKKEFLSKLTSRLLFVISEEKLNSAVGNSFDYFNFEKSISDFVFRQDGNHYGYVLNIDGEKFVVVDGKQEGPYDDILSFARESIRYSIIFSPNGNHYAYQAKRDGKEFIVFDGEEQRHYDSIKWNYDVDAKFTYLLSNSSYLYIGKIDKEYFVALDGEEYGPYDSFDRQSIQGDSSLSPKVARGGKEFIFLNGQEIETFNSASANGRVVYTIHKNEKDFVVLDGEVTTQSYDSITALNFSPDGNHYYYVAENGGKSFIVLDGEEQPRYDSIRIPSLNIRWDDDDHTFSYRNALTFSSDENHYYYKIERDEEYFAILDEKELGPLSGDTIRDTFFTMSPDGNHYAYRAKRDGKDFIVIDGQLQGPYSDFFLKASFSPNGNHYAYQAKRDGKEFIVFDGEEQRHYDSILRYPSNRSVLFSPDGEHYAYRAKRDGKEFAVLDGEEQGDYDQIFTGPVYSNFSSSNYNNYFVAKKGEDYFVIFDGEEQGPYDSEVVVINFSSDEDHYAYRAKRDGKEFLVFDGEEESKYDWVVMLTESNLCADDFEFSPDGEHYVYGVRRDGKDFIVLDGKEEGSLYDYTCHFRFIPNSNHYTYEAFIRLGTYEGDDSFIVIDGKEEGPYSNFLTGASFSPDGEHYIYRAHRDGKEVIVVDGVESSESYDQDIFCCSRTPLKGFGFLGFSPDSNHYYYTAGKGDEVFVVIDGKRGEGYKFILPLDETIVNENQIVYGAMKENGEVWLIVEDIN